MLALEWRISSDELNRAIFKVRNEDGLHESIGQIRRARATGDTSSLGDEVITGKGKNDRIIPWLALASFGWILFPDKRSGEDSSHYEVPAATRPILREAAGIKRRHRAFSDVESYVQYISRSAALPKDLR